MKQNLRKTINRLLRALGCELHVTDEGVYVKDTGNVWWFFSHPRKCPPPKWSQPLAKVKEPLRG